MADKPEKPENAKADDFVEAMTAAMPPRMERARDMTADELVAEMNKIPLFMTSLEEPTPGKEGAEDNVLIEALKAIAYEGTPLEVAQNFKDQGNEAARAKHWSDAREFYTKGILTLRRLVPTNEKVEAAAEMSVAPKNVPVVEDLEAEALKEKAMEETCLANRALCNLEMKNYGSCNRDCAAALKLNPRNVKAWYRAAMACLALDKLPEAADACTSGLSFDAENASLKTCLAKVQKRQQALAAIESARQQREERARNEVATLRFALHSRGILPVRKTNDPPEMEDAELTLADKNDAKSLLSFPVLLLYPLHAQTDFIKAFGENETLAHHLEYILPVPWDEKGEYKPDKSAEGVECYIETKVGGLIKAGRNLTIGKILGTGKVEIVDGLVRIFVVPKPRANEWIEQFKLRKGKQ